MALAALIAAYEPAEDGETLRATAPLAGATVVEHQARRAVRAGARHLILLVERLPAGLALALDRLRRDGIAIEFAPTIADAADRVHPDERLLLIADGCMADQAALDRVAAAQVPALLTVADGSGRDAYERIDGRVRWGGVALLDGTRLRDTAAMLGEWDPLSTLLRRAVQEGAARVAAQEEGAEGLPIFAHGSAGVGAIEKRLLSGTRGLARDWPGRFLFPWIEDPALGPIFRRLLDPFWLAAAAALLALIAVPVAVHSGGLALTLLLLSGPVASIAGRLALIRAAAVRHGERLEQLRRIAAALALMASTSAVAAAGGWGWWLVTAAILAGMAALTVERRIAARLTEWPGSPWFASTDGLIWAFLPFALLGQWGMGLAALAFYALASFAYVQWRLARHVRLAG
ncbi:hypothetical protein CLG96_11400 [Sphingomonas oleivorans]|uniref:Uncharacterized protein n=1 Tax=Sphingomonas oleivorans TaxID=1735121 RepID=A0A2T5FVI5_9SPHN|nr:hypothetical protein [Sphingomonas oleivorans]PTQ09781.1 hypothetical protein CLG96_11400 [Sphingomonas oleivorans]